MKWWFFVLVLLGDGGPSLCVEGQAPLEFPYRLFITHPKTASLDKNVGTTTRKEEPETEQTSPLGTAGLLAGDRINQGEDATSVRSKYGYYVTVLQAYSDSIVSVCGGSLVSPLFVLTAAHCIANLDDVKNRWARELRGVSVGFFGSEQEENLKPVSRIAARNYYVHKNYKLATVVFDLGVIELEEPVFDFEPITPDFGNVEVKLGDEVTAIGLGQATADSFPTRLQEKQLKLIPPSLCSSLWLSATRASTESSVLCTYADYLLGGLCGGDSGGAIIKVADDDNPDVLVGVTSFSSNEHGCGVTTSRKFPDGVAMVVAGRDDLWGPLVCNSERVFSATDGQGRRLRPLWCDGQDFAARTPPEPTPTFDFDSSAFKNPTKRYPYYAGIEVQDNISGVSVVECVGTLIHPYFVLTMAECVDQKFGDFEISSVRVGWKCFFSTNCSPREDYEDRNSVQAIAHPRFHQGGVWEMYNVGLIRLDVPVHKDLVKRFPVLDDGKAYRKALNNRNQTDIVALGIGETTPEFPMDLFRLKALDTTLVNDRSCKQSAKSFLADKYGSNVPIRNKLFGCANRLTLSGTCSSPVPAAVHPDRLLQGGSPLVAVPRSKSKPKKPDIVLGTLNFRTDEFCGNASTPDVYNRVSAYREWIQCVVCVGSVNATIAADVKPKKDPLCAPKQLSPTLTQDCLENFGISRGMYDAELLLQQTQEKNATEPPPPKADQNCLVSKRLESQNSTFEMNPQTGETAKCSALTKNGWESLFCSERFVVQSARENCPHACGLCG